jgi:hypothetical protein
VVAVKPQGQQGSPNEQHLHDDVIDFCQPGRKTDAAENDPTRGVRAADRRQFAPITPVVMRARSVIRGQPLSAEG